MAKFINLTPHAVHVLDDHNNVVLTVPAGETPLRLAEQVTPLTEVDGVPIVAKSLGGVDRLPPQQDGVYYIVSLATAQAVRRPDFLVPDDLVRDDQGRVIGCRRFAVIR